MPPKMGRPKADKPKSVNYTIRMDVETEKRLQAYCLKHEIPRSEAIRQGVHLLLAQDK
ncbi:CopG family transcriptional regulator [Acutalibacter sp. 1XD8-33]|nr:CopG family transcriptional regulator [Acutalibacter sp. 1XD8-33]